MWGIIDDIRRYKLTAITGYHQGFLFEHASWTALNVVHMNESFDRNLAVIAAFMHDIGKAGKCTSTSFFYADLDLLQLKISHCTSINKYGGCEYMVIAEHPERSYDYFTSEDPNKWYLTLEENRISPSDWEQYFTQFVSKEDIPLIRVACAAHYVWGKYIPEESILTFIRHVEMFFNAEKVEHSKENLAKFVSFVIMVSSADIFGALYDPSLKSVLLKGSLIHNEYSNYKMKAKHFTPEDQQELAKNNKKTELTDRVKRYYKESKEVILSYLEEEYMLNPLNNYHRFINGPIIDFLPKVIAFDLDRTLIYTQYTPKLQYHLIPSFEKVIAYCKRYSVKLAIISRHAYPKTFARFFITKSRIFDAIIVKYSGKTLENTFGWKKYLEEPNQSYIRFGKDEIDINDLWTPENKTEHITLLCDNLSIRPDQILLFDDIITSAGQTDAIIAQVPNFNPRNKEVVYLTDQLVELALKIYTFRRSAYA
jgi:hypothetical protein